MTKQSGFTIIELLIATLIFSIIVVVITVAVMQFSRQYYKGVISSSTQDVARTIVDDVTRSIQFNGGSVSKLYDNTAGLGPVRGYCIGTTKRYSFAQYQQVTDGTTFTANQGNHGLVSDTVKGCITSNTTALDVASPTFTSIAPPTYDNARELLGEHMRIAKFDIDCTNNLCNVDVRVVYGDNDLLMSPTNPSDFKQPDMTCRGNAGSQFCAASELTTTVKKRLAN